jgi:hypothetical protein
LGHHRGHSGQSRVEKSERQVLISTDQILKYRERCKYCSALFNGD